MILSEPNIFWKKKPKDLIFCFRYLKLFTASWSGTTTVIIITSVAVNHILFVTTSTRMLNSCCCCFCHKKFRILDSWISQNISGMNRGTGDPLMSKWFDFEEFFLLQIFIFMFGFLDLLFFLAIPWEPNKTTGDQVFWFFISGNILGMKRTTGDTLVAKQPDIGKLFQFSKEIDF